MAGTCPGHNTGPFAIWKMLGGAESVNERPILWISGSRQGGSIRSAPFGRARARHRMPPKRAMAEDCEPALMVLTCGKARHNCKNAHGIRASRISMARIDASGNHHGDYQPEKTGGG